MAEPFEPELPRVLAGTFGVLRFGAFRLGVVGW